MKQLLADLIPSGRRRFRARVHKMVNATGKLRAERNPAGSEVREHPELAHMTPAEQEDLLAVMVARAEAAKGRKKGKECPRRRLPRSRSYWPGQHARCGACPGLIYRFGKVLVCQNAAPGGPAFG